MNIIIVGCGKVGYTLAEQLNRENHNISVIDNREEKLRAVTDSVDAIGILGNGVSYSVLLEAGLMQADLLIAVTGSDEMNLLTCVIAKKAGHCRTIARVRNPLYNEEIKFLQDELGLEAVINPELTSAREIARVFQFPSAVKIDSFSKGRFELFHFRIPAGSKLTEYNLLDIRSTLKCNVLVCIVRRGEEVLIPKGDFTFLEGDFLAVAATPGDAYDFFKKVGLNSGRVKNAMIVGGGNIAFYLAKQLLSVGMHVKIIDQDMKRCDELSDALPQADVICGDGTDQNLLIREGIEHVDGFASLTGLDEENILLSLFAKQTNPSAKAVTKINRINFTEVLHDIHLDSVTYPRLLTADVIIRHARSMNKTLNINVENLYLLEDGRAEALEFLLKEESDLTGVPLQDLKLKKNLLICCISRNDKVITPGGQDMLLPGDRVVVVTTNGRLEDIKDIIE